MDALGLTLRSLLLLTCALSVLASACNDNDPQTEDYGGQLAELLRAESERTMAVIDETQGQDRGAFLTAYNSGFKDFVEDVRGLTPTPDANDAHQRFLTAIENTSTLLIEIEASAATTPGPTADEEFDQFTRSEALFGEVSAACSDLVQAIGRTPDALCFPD